MLQNCSGQIHVRDNIRCAQYKIVVDHAFFLHEPQRVPDRVHIRGALQESNLCIIWRSFDSAPFPQVLFDFLDVVFRAQYKYFFRVVLGEKLERAVEQRGVGERKQTVRMRRL
jgi:hypothetical protein